MFAIQPLPVHKPLTGAVAGALGKTLTAPLDRVKLLLQTSGGLQTGALQKAAKGGNLVQAFLAIGKAEGLAGYWKGNIPQILRVIPYSATQLYSYEVLKRRFKDKDGNLSVPARLAAGGCAGMMATLVTYPLDTLRLRLAVDPASRSIASASMAIIREGGKGAFFRGLGASLVGIAPYMALELAVFDLMPPDMPSFTRGFLAALLATTCCYPLDTVRRQIQLQSSGALKAGQVVHKIVERDGVGGLYRGFLPNALKNLPNKGAKLSTFHYAKRMLVASEQAYAKEVEIAEKAFQATASARAF
ncbi:hypothetical protein WJX72_006584 [[Myrmecia] bisecta]|uniref:Uncharacterized protein n=1 Tax=[Myrmecia] bisecta TaxID=41462 RepID=A0AAW1Q454_9CHLO